MTTVQHRLWIDKQIVELLLDPWVTMGDSGGNRPGSSLAHPPKLPRLGGGRPQNLPDLFPSA